MSEETKESYQADIFFRVPGSWVDKTVALFEAPAQDSGDFPPRFMITRHRRERNESIQMYARRLVDRLSTRLKDFEIVRDEPSRLATHAAQLVIFRWTSPSGPVTQQHLFVPGADRTILNLCAATRTADFDRYAETFREIFGSVRLPATTIADF